MLNTFVIFVSRVIGHVIDRVVFRVERGFGPAYFIVSLVAQLILGFLASLVVMWFSRQREFRADIGGAKLAGRQNMIAALARLQQEYEVESLPKQLSAFGIAGGGGLTDLLRSHPPLQQRIAALQNWTG